MNSWQERFFHLPCPDCIFISPSLIVELVGVLHASFSLWGYNLSCNIPIELTIEIGYIQFDFIQIDIIQIMDYGSVTKSILELSEKSTVWESTIKIPIAGNKDSLLDISSAA